MKHPIFVPQAAERTLPLLELLIARERDPQGERYAVPKASALFP